MVAVLDNDIFPATVVHHFAATVAVTTPATDGKNLEVFPGLAAVRAGLCDTDAVLDVVPKHRFI